MNWAEKDLKYIWHPCSQMKDYEELPPIVIDRGEGLYLYDIEGNSYMDIISSWWCNLLGHSNPKINEKLKEQVDKLEHVIFANFTHKPAIRLCELLSEQVPEGLAKYKFSDNGSSSVEIALKMSYQYWYQKGYKNKTKFMCLTGGYHGETIGALSVGSVDLYTKIYRKMLMEETVHIEAPDCYRCPYNKDRETCNIECFEHAEKAFKEYGDNTSAIIIEPIVQGSSGMRIYPAEYINRLRKLCDKYKVHLIADEIATGYGRTGKMFAFDHTNVSPDIMCIGKGLTGGYLPMAITITTNEIYDAFYGDYNDHVAFMHSHTYSGNPLACSTAIAVLKILKEDKILEKAKPVHDYMTKRINEEFKDLEYVGEVRSIGGINAIELVKDKDKKISFDPKKRTGYKIYKLALEKGLILRPLGDVLYFNPPLTITKEEVDKAIAICKESIEEILN